MANREWALELANDFETDRRGWSKGVMVRNAGFPDAPRLCFCLLGGIAHQAGVEVETQCTCGQEGCSLFRERMDDFKMLENETYMMRSAALGAYLSRGTVGIPADEYTNDNLRDVVINYNDDDDRTKEQVIAKLREFASAEQ